MSSELEPVPLTSQKHDPAWKHCQMFKNGDKVQLKCIYCLKIFKGGGIHRIKEHLAGQKGNASTCLRVQPDVRLQMQESLSTVVSKKRKKQKIAEEISKFHPLNNEIDTYTNNCVLSSDMVTVAETVDQKSLFLMNQEDGEGMGIKDGNRRKKGRVRKASCSAIIPTAVVLNNCSTLDSRTHNQVNSAIGRFFYDVGISFDAVKSVYFQPMIDLIASQRGGVIAPSYHDLRGCVLNNSLEDVKNEVDQCVGTWERSGCSVLVEEQVLEKGGIIANFLVYCPERVTFLKSVDISNIVDSPDPLIHLLKEVVEEVGVKNVLQVITNTEERYLNAAKKLTKDLPSVFWTPCAAHCISLILNDFGKIEWINAIIEQAKSMSRFVYNHGFLLNMLRKYTFGVDLIDVEATPSSTDFATLKRMTNVKHNLQSMVTSEEWMECPYSKKPEGLAILDQLSSESFWSSCTLIVRLTDSFLRLLRLARSEKKPAMGYIFAGIYRAKETIKKELVNKKDYLVYWDIIDYRWGHLMRHPLHAAGFYLNPKFFYSIEGDVHHNIRSSVYDCIEKLVPDLIVQDKLVKETTLYHTAAGDFGRKMAIRARDTLLPDEWWSTYGGGCPNLARLAIRILSQNCSLVTCNPNRTTIQQMHETKNYLEHGRLSDLVFVHYNLRLRKMVRNNKEEDLRDPVSVENIDVLKDWIAEKEVGLEESGSSDWMTIDPPVGDTALLGSAVDDVEDLGTGFDDSEIFEEAKHQEDKNGEVKLVDRDMLITE